MAKKLLAHFVNNQHISNIEIGAGCGNFGELYYSDCFLTDVMSVTDLNDKCGTCYVNITCDAYSIPCSNNRFENIIMCNPYGYGFKEEEDATRLFDELYRIVNKNGKIIILSTGANRYSAPNRVKKRLLKYNNLKSKERFDFIMSEINADSLYNGYIFKTGDGKYPVKPTYKMELICLNK